MNTDTENEAIEKAIATLWQRNIFVHGERRIEVVCLLRTTDYRPLEAYWWKGKEVSIVGADVDGNFLLRHCDGSVRIWDHREQADTLISTSLRAFATALELNEQWS